MIRQWLHNFPKENHRVDVILKAHDTQTLQYIVRLFIVLPLPIDDPQRLAARKQLEEVRIMVDRIARAKFEKWFRDTYPSLDSGFVFDIKEERSFVSINDEEDDLNPFQCYSLKESVFKNIKQSAENALAETAVSIRETDKESIPRLMKELDNAKEAEEREYVLNKIKDFTHHWLIDRFDRDISEKIDPLLFEFTKAVPKSVLSAYKNGYTKEIETFVDSKVLVDEKAMKKAFDVGWEITIEEMKKANEEYQKEWDMIVAEQKEKAQKEQVNNEPVYEVTKRSFSAGKIVLMVVVNTILIALLAVLLFRHFKNRREG